jgi:hypothetical protein
MPCRGFGAKPTLEEARAMPREYCEMSNDLLCTMSSTGDSAAIRERVIREVMSVDEKSWEDAEKTVGKIEASAGASLLAVAPYYTGMVGAFIGGIASFPLVFEKNTVLWFNHHYVTMDVPEVRDLETWLEVGAFSWNFSEPVLGQLSFALLTAQFCKSQMQNVGFRPYGDWLRESRAKRVVKTFPQYSPTLLRMYAQTLPL